MGCGLEFIMATSSGMEPATHTQSSALRAVVKTLTQSYLNCIERRFKSRVESLLWMGNAVVKANPAAMSTAKSFVDSAIRGERVLVFSKSYCPYCAKAKRALAKVRRDRRKRRTHARIDEVPYAKTGAKICVQVLPADKVTVIELDERKDLDGGAIQDVLLELTGGRSVPRVFVDGEFIGGGDDTDALERSGKLELMLKQKGIK